jgi:hypothetical protein
MVGWVSICDKLVVALRFEKKKDVWKSLTFAVQSIGK